MDLHFAKIAVPLPSSMPVPFDALVLLVSLFEPASDEMGEFDEPRTFSIGVHVVHPIYGEHLLIGYRPVTLAPVRREVHPARAEGEGDTRTGVEVGCYIDVHPRPCGHGSAFTTLDDFRLAGLQCLSSS